MILKNRKGDGLLTSNTLSMLIAVIGILILAFGFYKLWAAGVDQEYQNAQKTIDSIVGKVDALNDGESNKFLIQGFKGGEYWYIAGWSKGEAGRPNKCFFSSCLCVCKYTNTYLDYTNYYHREGIYGFRPFAPEKKDLVDPCGKNGYCRNVDKEEVSVITYDLEESYLLGFLEKPFTSPSLTPINWENIRTSEQLVKVGISKTSNKVEIYQDDFSQRVPLASNTKEEIILSLGLKSKDNYYTREGYDGRYYYLNFGYFFYTGGLHNNIYQPPQYYINGKWIGVVSGVGVDKDKTDSAKAIQELKLIENKGSEKYYTREGYAGRYYVQKDGSIFYSGGLYNDIYQPPQYYVNGNWVGVVPEFK